MRVRVTESAGWEGILDRLGIAPDVAPDRVPPGAVASRDRRSVCVLLDAQDRGERFFLKVHGFAGLTRRLGATLGRDPARREAESLLGMAGLGVPAALPVAWGRCADWRGTRSAFLLTRAVPNARDLEQEIAAGELRGDSPRGRRIRRRGLRGLGELIGRLHRGGYVDRDLHWRNVLFRIEDGEPRFWMIDSPKGGRPAGRRGLRRGIAHDLACLDKHAPGAFSRTERLRFFKAYRGIARLGADDRELLTQIAARRRDLVARRERKLTQDAARDAGATSTRRPPPPPPAP